MSGRCDGLRRRRRRRQFSSASATSASRTARDARTRSIARRRLRSRARLAATLVARRAGVRASAAPPATASCVRARCASDPALARPDERQLQLGEPSAQHVWLGREATSFESRARRAWTPRGIARRRESPSAIGDAPPRSRRRLHDVPPRPPHRRAPRRPPARRRHALATSSTPSGDGRTDERRAEPTAQAPQTDARACDRRRRRAVGRRGQGQDRRPARAAARIVVCRYQGGPNAGHTIIVGGETFKIRQIAERRHLGQGRP